MKIQFENGKVVEFDRQPTDADIAEVAKSFSTEVQQPSPTASKQEWSDYYKKIVKPEEPSLLQSEIVSPLASAVSTGLTAGVAKEGLGAINPELKARMFPEQRTIPGKVLRGGAELTATLAGLPQKIVVGGLNVASKLAPKYIMPAAKSLQGTVGQKLATGAVGGALGGASLASENLNPVEQAKQIGTGAVLGTAIPFAAKPVEKFLSPMAKKAEEIVNKNAKVYRSILNPGKDIIQKVEVKSGKKIDDFMKLAADENLVINQTPEGKLDTKAAVTALKDRKVELNAQLESALQSDPNKKFSLIDIANEAKANLAKHTRNASELKSAIESVDKQIADEIALHGDVVDGITANRIKGGMWDVSYSPLEPNKNKVSRQIGFAIKDAIERGYPDQAIKETNARLGDFVTLESILKKSDGNIVQRGKIGNYVGNLVGTGIGGALGSAVSPGVGTAVGMAGGAALGGAASKFLANPERITKGLPKGVGAIGKKGSELGDIIRGQIKTPIPSKVITPRPEDIEVLGSKKIGYSKTKDVYKALPQQAPETIYQSGSQEQLPNKQPLLEYNQYATDIKNLPNRSIKGEGFIFNPKESKNVGSKVRENQPPQRTTIPSKKESNKKVIQGQQVGGTKIPSKALAVGGVVGASALASEAQASQDIDMNKIYKIESSNNPEAHNKNSNAKGLGQITPIVLKEWNNLHPKDKHSDKELFNPEVNKKIASWYMNKRVPQLLKAKGKKDTPENRLIAYNAGVGYVGKVLPKETKLYLRKYKK